VVVAAGLLVAFPLPPRQIGTDKAEAAPAASTRGCSPCPLRAPAANELAVANNAGSTIVAAWIRRTTGARTVRARLLG
jgi:hypothetical protein